MQEYMIDLTLKNLSIKFIILAKEKSCIIMSLGIGTNLMKIIPFYSKPISENLEWMSSTQ